MGCVAGWAGMRSVLASVCAQIISKSPHDVEVLRAPARTLTTTSSACAEGLKDAVREGKESARAEVNKQRSRTIHLPLLAELFSFKVASLCRPIGG